MKYDYLIYIGRFQPFHVGHEQALRTALSMSSEVIVLIGSVNQARSVRNPWTYSERVSFIRANFTSDENQKIWINPLMDYLYNENLWIKSLEQTVFKLLNKKSKRELKIGIIGHQKDDSSYYLSLFPQWGREEIANHQNISSTDIRNLYFDGGKLDDRTSIEVSKLLEEFKKTDLYENIVDEFLYIKKYKQQWSKSPYPPIFVTVDALVVQSEHILLIQRKSQPGKGLMALPGGFVELKETLKNAVLRELREETCIKVSTETLANSITKTDVFDDPYRSDRGRTVTHAYLIELKDKKFPKVEGRDDAAQAFWIPISDITPELMFEDHYQIILTMIIEKANS